MSVSYMTLYSHIVTLGRAEEDIKLSHTTFVMKCHGMADTVNSTSIFMCEARDDIRSTDLHMKKYERDLL